MWDDLFAVELNFIFRVSNFTFAFSKVPFIAIIVDIYDGDNIQWRKNHPMVHYNKRKYFAVLTANSEINFYRLHGLGVDKEALKVLSIIRPTAF
jgi:hypothetical protein